jgi:hypothetical protein
MKTKERREELKKTSKANREEGDQTCGKVRVQKFENLIETQGTE